MQILLPQFLSLLHNIMTSLNLIYHFSAMVLYDRPPRIFHPISIEEKHNFFIKISQQYPEFGFSGSQSGDMDGSRTAFTQLVGDSVTLRRDRPGLLFSSTSWTPDEDFGVLMEALQGNKKRSFSCLHNMLTNEYLFVTCLIVIINLRVWHLLQNVVSYFQLCVVYFVCYLN